MTGEKKPVPTSTQAVPKKPLVTQIVEAVIDGAADIAKGVAVDAVARLARSAQKTKVGKAVASVTQKAEPVARRKPAKKAARKSKANNASANKPSAKKPEKKAPSKISKPSAKKSPSKARV